MKLTNLFLSLVLLFAFSSCKSGGDSSSSESNATNDPSKSQSVNVAKPKFNPEAGTYLVGQSIQIISPDDTSIVYVNSDGSEPTLSNHVFSGKTVTLSFGTNKSITLKAITVDAAKNISEVVTQTYNFISNPDSVEEAAPVLTLNYNYVAELSANGKNYVTFKPAVGGKYILDTCDPNIATSDTTDTDLKVFDSSSLLSQVASDSYQGLVNADVLTSHALLNATPATNYYVEITNKKATPVSSYQLRAIDISDVNVTASLVPDGSGWSNNLKACQRHFYKFMAEKDKTYVMYTDSMTSGGDTDTFMLLYKQDFSGIEAVNNDDPTMCPHCSAIIYKAPANGYYYFMVKPNKDKDTSDFKVYVETL